MNQTEPQPKVSESVAQVVASVPRINISVFCTSEATISAMQQVVVDRRMTRAHVDVRNGGIMSAAQAYSEATTPDVLILETEGNQLFLKSAA